jgi:hypothetical protein
MPSSTSARRTGKASSRRRRLAKDRLVDLGDGLSPCKTHHLAARPRCCPGCDTTMGIAALRPSYGCVLIFNEMQVVRIGRVASHVECLPLTRGPLLYRHIILPCDDKCRGARRCDFQGHPHEPIAHRGKRQFLGFENLRDARRSMADVSWRGLRRQRCAEKQCKDESGSFHGFFCWELTVTVP